MPEIRESRDVMTDSVEVRALSHWILGVFCIRARVVIFGLEQDLILLVVSDVLEKVHFRKLLHKHYHTRGNENY